MEKLPKIDLHMHTMISDGTDTPEEIILNVKKAGLQLFSITDHDAIKGCRIAANALKEDDPRFIPGVEFSCRDEDGKYHILGYAYDMESDGIKKVVKKGHANRVVKLIARLDFLKEQYGFDFPEEEVDRLFAMDNPGKPHLGNLMVKYGYAKTKEEAIKEYINKRRFGSEYLRPEFAIEGILASGGVPVLAHPSYGSGDEIIVGGEMEERLKKLMAFGLQGLEACYSGFPGKLRSEQLGYAEKYDLYVTAGSDYHGSNKMVELGDTCMHGLEEIPDGMRRFFERIGFELPEEHNE
ncbi:MAG: PHP domain-containing protein [Firmicutes bacterium]|nr:PHP domain-containing protein [Bacillota bacterium]